MKPVEIEKYSLSEIKARNHVIIKAHVNKVLFIIFLLLLCEGALRKWIFPELSKPLFFVKDIFIIYLYFYLAFKNKFPVNSWMSLTWGFVFFLYVLMALQVLFNELPFIVGLYGWRNYVLYIPLAFVIEYYMDSQSLRKLGRLICYASYPITLLAFSQYLSPTDAYVNKNVGTDNFTEIFTVADGVVRPSSTFAFTSGFVLYIGILAVFLVYNFFLKDKKFINGLWFVATVFALISCLAFSGSRSAYATIGTQVIFLVLSSFFLMRKKEGFQIIFYTIAAVLLGTILFNVVFDKQKELIIKRQDIAASAEGSVFSRIADIVIDPEALMQADLSTLGVGLGLGSGGGAYLATGVNQFNLAETEWGRIIMEAGVILGFGYILFRLSLTINLLLSSVRTLFNSSNPSCMVAFVYVGVSLAIGGTTGNGMTYSFTWLFFGVSLAMNKSLTKSPLTWNNYIETI